MASAAMKNKKMIVEQQPRATIYVRNYAKKAIMLILPNRIGMRELRQKIQRKMKVAHEDQALFLHGTLIPNDIEQLALENKLIFHLVNLKRINLEKIAISVKRIQPNSHVFKYNVYPQMKIGDFIANQFSRDFNPVDSFFLVYTGRQLQPTNTFLEQYVEDQSEILAIHKIQNLKSEFIELRKLNADQLGWRGKNQKKRGEHIALSNHQKVQQVLENQSEKTHDDQQKLKNALSQNSSQPVSKPHSQTQEKPQLNEVSENIEQPQVQKQVEAKDEQKSDNREKIYIEGEDKEKEVQKNQGQVTVPIPLQTATQNQQVKQKQEIKTSNVHISQGSEQISEQPQAVKDAEPKESEDNAQEKKDIFLAAPQEEVLKKSEEKIQENNEVRESNVDIQIPEDQEETQEFVIGQTQKYSMVSSHIKGPENENPRRLRSMNSNPKLEKDDENNQQNENQEDEGHKNDKSAGNMGLTVISSRHDEEDSINGSEFKPIQHITIQRDGVDDSDSKQIKTINRTKSANIALDEDQISKKEDKSQPVVPEDSQQKQEEAEKLLNSQNILEEQPIVGNDEQNKKQKQYQVTLYDIMCGNPPKQKVENSEAEQKVEEKGQIIVVTEKNEEIVEASKTDIQPQMNYQKKSHELKKLETIQENEDAHKENRQNEGQVNISENKQNQVTQKLEKKRSRNSEEYVRIMQERVGIKEKSQYVFLQDEPVQISDLKQQDRVVEFSNVFNPHYLQNEETEIAPVENLQSGIKGIPSHLEEGENIAIPEVHVENLESNIDGQFPPQKLHGLQIENVEEGLKQEQKEEEEKMLQDGIKVTVHEDMEEEEKQSKNMRVRGGMILLANEFSLGLESIQAEILEEYQKYLE